MALFGMRLPRLNDTAAARRYFERYENSLYKTRRNGLAICMAIFVLAGIFDGAIGGPDVGLRLAVRGCIAAIGILLCCLYWMTNSFETRDRILVSFGLIGMVGQIIMAALFTGETAVFYHLCIGISICFGTVVLVPRFHHMVILFCGTVLSYALALFFMDVPPLTLAMNGFFVALTASAALAGSFQQERANRFQAIAEIELKGALADVDHARQQAVYARDRAMQANEAKNSFLARMSHELRTPMNAIIGFSDLMRSEVFGPIQPRAYVEYADHILYSGKLMQTHIDDLLDHARLESGKMSWTDEEFILEDVIENWLSTCMAAADKAGIRIRCESPLPGVRITADPARVGQTVINLLNNAVKFTPKDGHVTVSASVVDNGALRLTVTDTGYGMNAEDLRRVRDPFIQVGDQEYVTGKGGLGLGLAIVSGIVSLMQGRLDLTSEEGVGTTATVEIPAERLSHTALCAV